MRDVKTKKEIEDDIYYRLFFNYAGCKADLRSSCGREPFRYSLTMRDVKKGATKEHKHVHVSYSLTMRDVKEQNELQLLAEISVIL